MADPDHFWMRWRLDVFLRRARRRGIPLDERLRVMDVGAGAGAFRTQLEGRTRWDVDALETNLQAISRMRPARGQTFSFDAHTPPPPLLSRYDGAFLFDVLEHIPDPARFAEASLRLVRDGGFLFVNVPALQCLSSNYDRSVGHLRRYDIPALLRDLEALPLQVLDVGYWGFSLLPWLAARTLLFKWRRNGERAVERGLQPPGRWADALLNAQKIVENGLFRRPPIGTSIMLLARKTAG